MGFLVCCLEGPLRFHREDGRTGGPRGFCCSSRQSSHGNCAGSKRRRSTRNPKFSPRDLPSSHPPCEIREGLAMAHQEARGPKRLRLPAVTAWPGDDTEVSAIVAAARQPKRKCGG